MNIDHMSTSEMFTTHVHQGVVTFMSRVEVFATGFKIESGNQSPFGGANQGIKVTSELLKIKNAQLQFDL